MAEQGAIPQVSKTRRHALRAVRAFFTPLLPDDYLELINPLWSTRELRGRIERIEPETADAATVLIRPGYEWMGHRPGQYLRIGVVVDGVHHWRAYSLTSDPGRPDGCIAITPKLVEAGKVRAIGASNYSAARLREALSISGERGLPRYEVVQPGYNLYDRARYESELAGLAQEQGLGVVSYFSLASGFLAGKYRSVQDLKGTAREAFLNGYFDRRGMQLLEALREVASSLAAMPRRSPWPG